MAISFMKTSNNTITDHRNNGTNNRRVDTIEVQYETNGYVTNDCKDTDVIELLTPIISLMKVLGTWPQSSETLWQRMNVWNAVTLFILHFYSFEIFGEYLFKVRPKTSFLSKFVEMSTFFRAFVVMIVIDIRFLRQQKVLNLFRQISTFPTFSEEHKLTNLLKLFKNLKIGFFAFVVIQSIVSMDALLRQTFDSFVDLIFHNLSQNSDSGLFVFEIFLMTTKWFCYLFFVIFNECSNKIYFLCICLIIRNKIRDFNSYLRHLAQRNTICSIDQIQQIYRMHCVLTSIVDTIEDNFSVQSFLWVFSIVINLCVKIQVIITGIKTNDFSLMSFILTDLFYLTTIFVSILLISSEIGEQNSEPVLSVTKMGENSNVNDSNLQQSIQLLVTKLNTPSMCLTGWKCFEFSKSFLLTVMGALITYMVVVLQMS